MTIATPNTDAQAMEIHAPIPETQKEKGKNIHWYDAKKMIAQNLLQTPGEGKVNKPLKNQEKIDEIIETIINLDPENISNVQVDPKLKKMTFIYKKTHKIQYEPNRNKGEKGIDNITIFEDSLAKKGFEVQIAGSLFKKDLEPKYKDKKLQKTKFSERMDLVVKIFSIIKEKLNQTDSLVFNYDEPIIAKGNKIYFSTEKQLPSKKNNIPEYDDTFRVIEYQQEKKLSDGTTIPEKYTIKEIKNEDDYYNNAYL